MRRLKRGRPRFSPHDLAVLRICQRNGWSIEHDWDALSEWEQNEWMAYMQYVETRMEQAEQALISKEYHYTPETFVAFLLARL